MFNPERLLGGLLRSGTRRSSRGMGSMMKGGAALGLVGIAWEAVEHYMNNSQTGGQSSPPPMMPPSGGQTLAGGSPPPPPGAVARGPQSPPPVPGTMTNSAAAPDQQPGDAVLLIRAMIAAANADGSIDAAERASILNKLKSVQLSEEEHQFITHELLDPKDLRSIVESVTSTELARQVYMVSVMAIEVDTDEELDYLQQLAQNLNLDNETVQRIHEQLGVEIYF